MPAEAGQQGRARWDHARAASEASGFRPGL